MTNPVRVFLLDDHPLLRSGLRLILEGQANVTVVGEAGTAAEFFDLITNAQIEIDVLILDISLPDRSGMQVLHDLKALAPSVRVLVYTRFPADQYAVRALKAGADGFLNKTSKPENLIEAIGILASGETYMDAKVAGLLSAALREKRMSTSHDDLSEREFEILRLLVAGASQTDVANKLGLSAKTINTHRTNIMAKLGVSTFADLVRYSILHNIDAEG
jgi:DNA-binding NarL/FixJ family response regulator